MAGTREGGLKVKERNLAKDPDFYKKIGKQGGKNSSHALGNAGGFAANPELARIAGFKGGRISRRPKEVTEEAILDDNL